MSFFKDWWDHWASRPHFMLANVVPSKRRICCEVCHQQIRLKGEGHRPFRYTSAIHTDGCESKEKA